MADPARIDGAAGVRRRILLVEDHEGARVGLARLLEAFGFSVTVAEDGRSAMKALADSAPPDFLLTDLRLPDLDGREIAREASRLEPAPRVALITGWDVDQGLQDHAEWGIDWVLAKPIDVRELLDLMNGPARPLAPDAAASLPDDFCQGNASKPDGTTQRP